MNRFSVDVAGQTPRFVLSDWLSTDLIAAASLLWVVSSSPPQEQIAHALQNRIPLLVPDSETRLKALCTIAGCGLYYRDSAEAYECIEFLLERKDIRSAMGINGFNYAKLDPRWTPAPLDGVA
jgi:hypothetical protein